MKPMKLTEIKILIDKAIGKRGLIRTPAWWVRKIFYELIEWVTSSLTQNKKEIQRDVDKSLEKSLPYISVYSSSTTKISLEEGKTYQIPASSWVKIPYQETFKFNGYIQLIDFRGAYLCPKDLSHLFENKSLFNLDLSPLNTSEATDMSYMFSGCNCSTYLKLGKLNIANVRDMSYMFKNTKFTTIDMTCDHSSQNLLEKAVGMFEGCSALCINFYIYLSPTPTDFTGIFRNCASLKYINPDFSNPNIGFVYRQAKNKVEFPKATSLKEAFKGCSKLTRLDVDPSSVSSEDGFESMFEGCSSLTYLSIYDYFDTIHATSLKDIFKGCSAIETLILGTRFFRLAPENDTEVDFSDMTKWVNFSVKASLVTNLYTRTSSDLAKGKITIKLSQETYNVLTEDQLTTITNKGYNVTHS